MNAALSEGEMVSISVSVSIMFDTVIAFPLLSAGEELAPGFQLDAAARLYVVPPPEVVPFLLSRPAN